MLRKHGFVPATHLARHMRSAEGLFFVGGAFFAGTSILSIHAQERAAKSVEKPPPTFICVCECFWVSGEGLKPTKPGNQFPVDENEPFAKHID